MKTGAITRKKWAYLMDGLSEKLKELKKKKDIFAQGMSIGLEPNGSQA